MQNPDRSIHISAILLAAGSSSRLGRPKQLVEYQGEYLINYIAEIINQTAVNDFSIILGANSDMILSKLQTSNGIIINSKWQNGMGTSISIGAQEFQDKADGLLVCLVDQYKLSAEIISRCIDAFRKNPTTLVACQYKNQIIGPPVIFPKRYFRELIKLDDDKGARNLIKRLVNDRPDEIILVSFPNGNMDVDKPEDLDKLNTY